ncbi:hypothetical protein [Deinococcus sp.]|uniref:hypothetical protein n=1 Tax=Deinococcus sp. TaxID=47478 RepID=UPI0025F2E341|nr:hypothetical protein [Deinococcus sp.]
MGATPNPAELRMLGRLTAGLSRPIWAWELTALTLILTVIQGAAWAQMSGLWLIVGAGLALRAWAFRFTGARRLGLLLAALIVPLHLIASSQDCQQSGPARRRAALAAGTGPLDADRHGPDPRSDLLADSSLDAGAAPRLSFVRLSSLYLSFVRLCQWASGSTDAQLLGSPARRQKTPAR